MAMTINIQQSSFVHLSTCNNRKDNYIFKSNHSFSTKFPLHSSFTQLKHNNYQNATTKALLKPFIKPLSELLLFSTPANFTSEPLFFGGGWAQTGVSSGPGRAEVRAWSGRRPGSKTKDKRLTIDLECSVCLKHRYTTERHKDFARRSSEKEKLNKKKPSNLDQENNIEFLSEKEQEKEKRRVKREAEKREVNNSNILLLFKFCPKCRSSTLHKEVKNRRN